MLLVMAEEAGVGHSSCPAPLQMIYRYYTCTLIFGGFCTSATASASATSDKLLSTGRIHLQNLFKLPGYLETLLM
jgi:hypothetical protein